MAGKTTHEGTGRRTGAWRLLLASASIAAVLAASEASAQMTDWIGGTGSWFDAPNWNNGVPTAGGPARINASSAVVVIGSPGAVSGPLWFDRGRLTIQGGGTLASDGPFHNIGWNIDPASMLITGAGSAWNVVTGASGIRVGYHSDGTLTLAEGGAINVSGTGNSIVLGEWEFGTSAGFGTLVIGAAVGDTPVAPGIANVGQIEMGLNAGGDPSLASGLIVFNHTSTSYNFSPIITGNGRVEHRAGTTTVTGAGSYTGATDILGGTLRAGAANVFSAASAYTVGSGATLDLNSFSQSIGSLAGAGNVIIGASTATVLTTGGDNSDTLFSGVISGPGSFIKTGTGTMTLTNANSYTGITWVRFGTLAVDGGGIGHPSTSTVVGEMAGENGTLIVRNGGTVQSTLSYIGANAGSEGTVTVTGANSTWTVGGGIPTLNVGFSGTGTLTVSDGGLVGASTVPVAANAGSTGTLRLDGDVAGGGSGVLQTGQVSRGTGLSAGVVFDGGTLRLTDNQANLFAGFSDGEVTLGARGALIDTQNFTVTTGLGLEGAGGLTKLGSGILELTGDNTYSGATDIVAGTLSALTDDALSASSAFRVNSGATLHVADGIWTEIASLSDGPGGGGSVVLDGLGALSIVGGSDTTFSGVFSGTGGLGIEGPGMLTLTGTGSQIGALSFCACAGVGGVTIQGGTMDITDSGAFLEEGVLAVTQGGVLRQTDPSALFLSLGSRVSVEGPGSTIGLAGIAIFGLHEEDALAVRDGGRFEAEIVLIAPLVPGASGSALVTGAGSALEVGSVLAIGIPGGGFPPGNGLKVADGGLVRAGDSIAVLEDHTLFIGTGGLAGHVETPEIVNDGAIVANFTDTSTLDADVSGDGSLTKLGAGTLVLTGASSYAGGTAVNGGRLLVNGSIAGPTIVGAGGTLGGTGTVGPLTVGSGGTVAPGNSIGTLNVASDLLFSPGSAYAVEIAAGGANDLIRATGTATIDGGAVKVATLDPEASYLDGQTYRILEAGAGVVRNADLGLDHPFLFMNAALGYGPGFVDLTLRKGAVFPSVARTSNQTQAAGALEGFAQSGDALTVFNAFLALTDADAARRAFDLASGEAHASGQHMVGNSFGLFAGTLGHQGMAGPGAGGGTGGQVFFAPLGYGPSVRPGAGAGMAALDAMTVSAHARERSHRAWMAPVGARGTVNADANAAALDWWSLGVAGGYEAGLDGGRGVAGFGFGYIRSGGVVPARLSSVNADGLHLGAYGGWTNGPWRVSGSLAYAANHISTTRNVVVGGLNRTARADYWSHTAGLSGEAAYGFDMGGGTTISPLVRLDAGWSGHGGFTETGAGALDLTGAAQGWTRLDAGLGAAVSHSFTTAGGGKVTLEARALWEHAFADVVPSQNLSFAGSPANFTVAGPDAGRDRLRLGAGVSFQATESLSVRARYDGTFSGRQQSHAATIRFSHRF